MAPQLLFEPDNRVADCGWLRDCFKLDPLLLIEDVNGFEIGMLSELNTILLSLFL